MKERYSYIEPWDQLQDGMHKTIVDFATGQAKVHDVDLWICVHNKSSCEQFITKAVGEPLSKKLRNNLTVQINGVSVSLHSSSTLKKNYSSPSAVYLLFFPGAELLDVVEKQSEAIVMIVFSENDNHTEATDAWLASYDVKRLKPAKE